MSKNNNKRTNRNSTMVQEKPVKNKEANADRKKAIAEKLERKKAAQETTVASTVKAKTSKTKDIVELARLGELDVSSLEKPDTEDKEATRKYYEALSIAKANKGFKKSTKEKNAVKVKNNHIKRSHVKPNVFVRLWAMFRVFLTKDLSWKDWWKVIVGIFAVIVILSMVVLPLLSLFSWRNYLGLGLF